jgi:hypothetical protein
VSGLDLSGVARVIDSWRVDHAVILRDSGVGDDVLDPETGTLIPTAAQAVWAGTVLVQNLTGFTELGDPDVARVIETTEARHRALLGLGEAPNAQVGDLLVMTAVNGSPTDPMLVDASFEIVDFGGPSSVSVTRIVYLKQVGSRPGRVGASLVQTGHGPPDVQADLATFPGMQYLDLDSGVLYQWED